MDEMQNRKDIMSHLLVAKDPKTGDKLTDAEVWGEAHLMIAAGKFRRKHYTRPFDSNSVIIRR